MHAMLTYPTLPGGRFFTKECVRGYCFGFNGKRGIDGMVSPEGGTELTLRIQDILEKVEKFVEWILEIIEATESGLLETKKDIPQDKPDSVNIFVKRELGDERQVEKVGANFGYNEGDSVEISKGNQTIKSKK